MLLPSRVIDLIPQKNLASNNSIAGGPWLGQANGLLGEPKDPIGKDRFKEMISDLVGNELRDQQVNILAAPMIPLSQYQAVPILKTTDLQSYPASGLENPPASPGELYHKRTTLKRTLVGVQPMLDMSDPKIVGKAELLPFEEPGAASPIKHDVEGLIDHLFIKDLSARIEGRILSNTDPKEGGYFTPFHNNAAREEEGPYTFSISRNTAQERGESSRQLFFGTKLTGEEGDIKDKPNLDKELGLFFHYNSGNGEDSGKILTNNTNHTSNNKVSVNSHININDSQPLNEIQDLFFQGVAHRAKEDTNSISINIDRDDLGRLKLDISVRDNMVKAEIVTEYPRVKEMIELNQGRLRDALSDHGLEMSYLSVSVDGGQSEGLNYQGMAKDQSTTHNHHDIVIPEEDNDLICRAQCQSDSSISIFA